MDPDKAERRLAEAVRASGIVEAADLEWAIGLQRHASEQGRALPLDRILVHFKILTREQADSIALAVRYHVWRKEDKFYAKIAVQSNVMPETSAKECLSDQKRLYRDTGRLRRLNAIAADKKLVSPKEDRAILAAMRKLKPITLAPADAAPPEPPPAKPLKLSGSGSRMGLLDSRASGELDLDPAQRDRARMNSAKPGQEQEWRDKVRKRELDELSNALGDSKTPQRRGTSDEDLDALWDEADLDDIELDSEARDAAKGAKKPAPLPEDESDDLRFLDDDEGPPSRRGRGR